MRTTGRARAERQVVVAANALVVPVGPPGAGKSTMLARAAERLGDPGLRFGADDVRRLAFGTVADQRAGRLVHRAARAVVAVRLAAGLPAAYDATNTTRRERAALVELAHAYGVPAVALVFAVPVAEAQRRNAERAADEVVPAEVVARFAARVAAVDVAALRDEGFDAAAVVDADTDVVFSA